MDSIGSIIDHQVLESPSAHPQAESMVLLKIKSLQSGIQLWACQFDMRQAHNSMPDCKDFVLVALSRTSQISVEINMPNETNARGAAITRLALVGYLSQLCDKSLCRRSALQ